MRPHVRQFGAMGCGFLLAAYIAFNFMGHSEPLLHVAAVITLALGIALMPRGRRSQIRTTSVDTAPEGYLVMVRRLTSAIDAGDPFTRGRSYRVSKMCLRLGKEMGLDEEGLVDLEYAGLLHDIGRSAIHREILLKTDRFNDAERATMRTHPALGYEILKDCPFLTAAAEIVHAHHEQPDGKGYPRGLSGRKIPVGSRIIMVAAAFDAMTTDRPYRRGLSVEEAYEELKKCSGTMFFKDVADHVIRLHQSGKLFDEIDPVELVLHSSAHFASRAFDSYLKEIKLPGSEAGGETGAGAGIDPEADPADLGDPADLDRSSDAAA